MRRVKIFSGSSHLGLAEAITERLGTSVGKSQLRKFANGETSVDIGVSIRDQDVFVVQSGSSHINDSIMELLIMINACKGGSANKITAVMPYFPYSKQSKKKAHRGAITARMVANLLHVAGVDHVITVDLHASQMQGFFRSPVDNLYAEPLIARWIRHNVENWRDSVVVSKNPGGTKRVTQLADVLKLNFALITTDRRRVTANGEGWMSSQFQSQRESPAESTNGYHDAEEDEQMEYEDHISPPPERTDPTPRPSMSRPAIPEGLGLTSSALFATRNEHATHTEHLPPHPQDDAEYEYSDDHAHSVTYGRLVQGHIVDDDFPSPTSAASEIQDPMLSSIHSLHSLNAADNALGGTIDAHDTDDEEEKHALEGTERMITLVGEVRGRTALILDDMIDRAGTWIAAAEHVKKRGGAKKVVCLATHGVFGDDCLRDMTECECIDQIVVTNSFPIDEQKGRQLGGIGGFNESGAGVRGKLTVIDLSGLLSEAIRRNHNGESISALFQHYDL